ncbi:MAG: MtnX-like HAD-IB family phosphatase [Candidatus Omnitrophica bacterium]|nr:MtnX-like HAD-IB family phosphatase [Candidatus Omnitrophota bacterium]
MDQIKFFIDFDGTITRTDVVDLVLQRFSKDGWQEAEKSWIQGRIGSRECLTRQIGSVSATKEDVRCLLKEVEVDPYFVSFWKKTRNLGIPIVVVSDGFDFIIREIFGRLSSEAGGGILRTPLFSNRLAWVGKKVKASFSKGPLCEHGCANCKERVIRKLRKKGDRIIFIGDGWSDRFAASVSHLTFAKGRLLKYCCEHRVPHRAYSSFKEVEEWLKDNISC